MVGWKNLENDICKKIPQGPPLGKIGENLTKVNYLIVIATGQWSEP